MSVGIVIPAYNAEQYLQEAVESVVGQTFPDWEMVIVNDGSTDGTASLADILARTDRRIRVVSQANAGIARTRNRGIHEVSPACDTIAFLDADDLWEPDALDTLFGALAKSPEALAAHAMGRFIDGAGNFVQPGELEAQIRNRYAVEGKRLVPWPVDRPTTFAVQVVMNAINMGAIIVRRAAFETVGLFDTGLKTHEDLDMWLRICQQGSISFADKPVFRYRRHDSNVTSSREFMAHGENQLWRKLLESVKDNPVLLDTARRGYRYHHRYMATIWLRWAKAELFQSNVAKAAKQLRHAALCYCKYLLSKSQHKLQ